MSETFRILLEQAAGDALPGWPQVAAAMRLRHVDAGATVFDVDVEHPFVYTVRSGLLKLVYLDADGHEWIKSFVPAGAYFASLSALEPGGRTSFIAAAIEPSVLEQIEYRRLEAIGDTDLTWARTLRVLTMAFAARKEQREKQLLTLSAESRYRLFVEHSPHLRERVSQKDLARYLGVTPVGLNRIVRRVREISP